MKEAYLYERQDADKIRCRLCRHGCLIAPGSRGICGVRENQVGTLYSLVYDKIIARHCDPIEKKPLFHFLPGSFSYSIATPGCNFRCPFCQNADISQMPAEQYRILGEAAPPSEIVRLALAAGAASISYTYTEPTVFYELAADTSRLAVREGLKNVFVTNGYMSAACLEDLAPDLHAANVDLKAFTDGFYHRQCGAKLKPVLENLEILHRQGVWLEVTTLLIPGLNDGTDELRELARYLAALNPYIPWHISRFYPTYRLTHKPRTPPESVRRAREIGYEAGLKYVYTGNLPGDEGEKTFCHGCGTLLIDRLGFHVAENRLTQGLCPRCGEKIPGVWQA